MQAVPASLSGAAIMNSWAPAVAVTAIGPDVMPEAKSFTDLLQEAYRAEPAVAVQ